MTCFPHTHTHTCTHVHTHTHTCTHVHTHTHRRMTAIRVGNQACEERGALRGCVCVCVFEFFSISNTPVIYLNINTLSVNTTGQPKNSERNRQGEREYWVRGISGIGPHLSI